MSEARGTTAKQMGMDAIQYDVETFRFCGQQIKEAQNRLHMSLEDMAARLGIDRGMLRMVENGAALYPAAIEAMLDSGLGIREEWLFEGEEPMIDPQRVHRPDAVRIDGLREIVYERMADANDHTKADEQFQAYVHGLLGEDTREAQEIIGYAQMAAGALEAPMFEQGMRYAAQLMVALLSGRALVPPEGFRAQLAETVNQALMEHAD